MRVTLAEDIGDGSRKFLWGIVAEHGGHGEIHPDKAAFRGNLKNTFVCILEDVAILLFRLDQIGIGDPQMGPSSA